MLLFLILVFQSTYGQNRKKCIGIDSVSKEYLLSNPISFSTFDSLTIDELYNKYIETAIKKGYITAAYKEQRSDSMTQIIMSIGHNFAEKKSIKLQFEPALFAYCDFKKKDSLLSLHEYLNKRSRIIEYYENNGYPFIKIYMNNIEIETETVKAKVLISPNNQIHYGSITYQSDDVSLENDIFKNIIGLKTGSLYSKKQIDLIPEIVNEFPFMENVSTVRQTLISDSIVDIECFIKHKPANRFDGIIGFAPKNSDNLTITGKISIQLNNMLKKAEQITTEWEKIDNMSQKLKVTALFRYIFNTKFGIEPALNLLKQDSTYMNTDIKIAIPYYLSYNKIIKPYYYNSTSSVIGNNSELSINHQNLADIKKNGFGCGTKLWKIDYIFNPRRGYLFELEIDGGDKTSTIATQLDTLLKQKVDKNKYVTCSSHSNMYIPVSKQTVFVIENRMAFIHCKTLYANESFRMGGFKDLKGFDENSIYCTRFAMLNFEYRLLFQRNSNIYTFFNGMIYENNSLKEKISDTPYGFGIGMNIQSHNNIFSISYAYGHQFNNKIMLNLAKIHFGFITVF